MLSPQSGANVQAMMRLPVMTRTRFGSPWSLQTILALTTGGPSVPMLTVQVRSSRAAKPSGGDAWPDSVMPSAASRSIAVSVRGLKYAFQTDAGRIWVLTTLPSSIAVGINQRRL